jgi:hypothetical protein
MNKLNKDLKLLKYELQNIIKGKSFKSKRNLIQATQAYLRSSSKTSKRTEANEPIRTSEERTLIDFANREKLWFDKNKLGVFIAEGAE